MSRPFSICVFCGSSDAAPPSYLDLAERTGAAIARARGRLVFGGGRVGLMGRAARGARAAGGETYGVIPTFLRRIEVADEGGTLIEVATMHERKAIMYEQSDAFLVLPGGIGTLEEAVEILSWRRLSLHEKPMVFLAEDDFWDGFFGFLDRTIEARLTSPALAEGYSRVHTVEAAIAACRHVTEEQAVPPIV
jgi:uncharacterized protein (TIGR00730 family)